MRQSLPGRRAAHPCASGVCRGGPPTRPKPLDLTRSETLQGVPAPTPSARQAAGFCLLAPDAAKVACPVRGRGQGLIRRQSSNPLFSAHDLVGAIQLEACDQETALGRKCPSVLVVVKGGASPPLGGAGKPRNQCCRRWQLKSKQDRRRDHESSDSEVPGELAVTGFAPASQRPQLIA